MESSQYNTFLFPVQNLSELSRRKSYQQPLGNVQMMPNKCIFSEPHLNHYPTIRLYVNVLVILHRKVARC